MTKPVARYRGIPGGNLVNFNHVALCSVESVCDCGESASKGDALMTVDVVSITLWTGVKLAGIYHFRRHDPLRPEPNNRARHTAIVVRDDGACFRGDMRSPGHHYVRKHWCTSAVGQALRAAVRGSEHPNFWVDPELPAREMRDELRVRLFPAAVGAYVGQKS